jgi:TolA-binding protein
MCEKIDTFPRFPASSSNQKLLRCMRILPRWFVLVGLMGAMAPRCLVAQDLTADEMRNRAVQLMNTGDWAEAAAQLQELLTSFGTAEALKERLPFIRYDLAISLLQARQFEEALPVIEEALGGEPPLTNEQRRELTFWLGVTLMQEEKYPAAREALEKFIGMFPVLSLGNPSWRRLNPDAAKVPEARLLIGATWLLEEKHLEGANYLAEISPELLPENQGRATILRLYGLLAAAETDPKHLETARDVVVAQFPKLADLTQLAAFQVMTLQLGAAFLEQENYREAIRCLQRVWPRERVLRRQEDRLQELRSRLQALEADPRAEAYQKFLVQQMIAKVEREVANFAEIGKFDAALRLRLASAYGGMERYRESSLILEEMLDQMEPSPVVESASASLVQSWGAIERWPKVIEASEKFATKFPQSGVLPQVLYLRGVAEQKDQRYAEAQGTFAELEKQFPESDFAPRARFQQGFTQLLAEDNPGAIETFLSFPKSYPKHEFRETAQYWLGMAYSLDEQNEAAREVLAEYLREYPSGSFVAEAKFRRAYAAQQAMDFTTAMAELQTFLDEYPGHALEPEALVLLGDGLMNEGRMEEGMAAFARVPPEQTRFFEEGYFKTAKALRLMEETERLQAHLGAFVETYPASPRVAEALFEMGKTLRQQGEDEAARQLYWKTLAEHGNNVSMRSIEDLFSALQRLYRGDESAYLAGLRDLVERAGGPEAAPVLSLRADWARAKALAKTDPQTAQMLLLDGARRANVETTSPQMLADFAEALFVSGNQVEAEQLFRDLVKWNPRAPQKDRALARIGLLQVERGQAVAARETFERFCRETSGSHFTGQVLLALAGIQEERGESEEALATLESLLAEPATTGREKAEALHRMGQIHLAAGRPGLAVPYFQRVYIMHGRWHEWVAKSYYGSGLAFEKLDDVAAARKTYEELLQREDLADFAETSQARSRLEKLPDPS